MKSESNNSSRREKIKPEKEINNKDTKNLSFQKNKKENKNNSSKKKPKNVKFQVTNEKSKPKSVNKNKNEFKHQYYLFKKDLEALKIQEEKVQELKDRLKLQHESYYNISNKTSKKVISKSSVKNKKKKFDDIFSSSPVILKKNLLDIIVKSTKSKKDKKDQITNYSHKNIYKSTNPINNKPKLNINLFSPINNKADFLAHTKDFKNKYNRPYKTIYTVRNKKVKTLLDSDNQDSSKRNKKEEQKNKKEQKIKKEEQKIKKDEQKIKKEEQKYKTIGILSEEGMETEDKKKINQDNYFNYDLKNGYKFIGVCDGHGENGKQVSDFIKNNLPKELEKELNVLISSERKRISILEGMLRRNDDENNTKKKEKNSIENILDLEKMKELLKKAFVSTNYNLFAEKTKLNLNTSGSTCVSVFYKKNPIKKLYIANLGDSRAIIIKEKDTWSFEQLSRDHKPSESDEAERIMKFGGEIQRIQNEEGISEGPLRIFKKGDEGPGLAMSRSFGDSVGQSLGIIAEPEVKEYLIQKEDRALIIATDGLWEYTSNQEVADVVKKFLDKKDVNNIISELYNLSVENWQKENCNIDDITIICVLLN